MSRNTKMHEDSVPKPNTRRMNVLFRDQPGTGHLQWRIEGNKLRQTRINIKGGRPPGAPRHTFSTTSNHVIRFRCQSLSSCIYGLIPALESSFSLSSRGSLCTSICSCGPVSPPDTTSRNLLKVLVQHAACLDEPSVVAMDALGTLIQVVG